MADETDPDVPPGYFARIELGSTLNQYLANLGIGGRKYPPQSSAPSNPEIGDTYLADGTNWDPAGSGNGAFVQYDGSSWVVILEHTAAGGF